MVRAVINKILILLNIAAVILTGYTIYSTREVSYVEVATSQVSIPIEYCTFTDVGNGEYICSYNEYLAYKNYLVGEGLRVQMKSIDDFLCTSPGYEGRYIYIKNSSKLIKISPNMEDTSLQINYN